MKKSDCREKVIYISKFNSNSTTNTHKFFNDFFVLLWWV